LQKREGEKERGGERETERQRERERGRERGGTERLNCFLKKMFQQKVYFESIM